MMPLETALEQILASMPQASPERVNLGDALGRVLLESVVSPMDWPAFDNSAVDGYAVRSEDVKQAALTSVKLRIVGRIAAGSACSIEVKPFECVRLFTGSPLPAGADAVVMQEDSRTVSDEPAIVEILDAAKPWENVRLRGVDVKLSEVLCDAGETLTAASLAVLSGAGVSTVSVGKRPSAAVLATGSELREPGEALGPGQIYESNRAMLAGLIEGSSGLAKVLPIVRDDPDETRRALEDALSAADLVITSGGVSVGEYDHVKEAFHALGGRSEFWKIAMRPGKPFFFGTFAGKFLFGLPGNPVSAFVTFKLLVEPAIRRWQGAHKVLCKKFQALLAEPMSNPGDRRHFVRVKFDESGRVCSAGLQQSHALKSLVVADGLVELPPGAQMQAGDAVWIIPVR
jgi:molybdopterin molybdotransferase